MRVRLILVVAASTAVLALTGCVPALQGLARLNDDATIDVVVCGDYESATLEFDFYLADETGGERVVGDRAD